MKLKALVIDDDPAIIEAVGEILESLGHEHDSADCVTAARDLLSRNQHDYFLLDLEIPVHRGRGLSRIQNGQNLLEEIRKRPDASKRPVIVMTAHGKDGPDLAVEVMKLGAVDYVTKPFPTKGETLDKKINEALSRVGAATPTAIQPPVEREPFRGGTMVFYEDRVELCGVKICGGRRCGQVRKILEALRRKQASGTYVAYGGAELAQQIGCSTGQNGVAAGIRNLRTTIADSLAAANIECGRDDVILSGGPGYRLKEWMVVQDGRCGGTDLQGHGPGPVRDVPVNVPVSDDGDPVSVPVSDDDDPVNVRRAWLLSELGSGHEVRVSAVAKRLRCSAKTIKRDLGALKSEHPIEFVGPAKTGHYRIRPR